MPAVAPLGHLHEEEACNAERLHICQHSMNVYRTMTMDLADAQELAALLF